MGEIIIKTPIAETDIESLAKALYNSLSRKEDFVNLSKANWFARTKKYPRTKTTKYGRLPRGMGLDQLTDFFSLFKRHEYRFRFYCLWSVWWGTRCGEANRLNMKDFNFEAQSIMIHREKGEGPQELKIADSLWAVFQEYYLEYKQEIEKSEGNVFFSDTIGNHRPNCKTKHWSNGYIRYKFREVCSRSEKFCKTYAESDCWSEKAKKRKLYQFCVHSLRYSFAYMAIDVFKDITIVKELMGHKNIKSTEIYLENKRRAETKEHSLILQAQNPLSQLL